MATDAPLSPSPLLKRQARAKKNPTRTVRARESDLIDRDRDQLVHGRFRGSNPADDSLEGANFLAAGFQSIDARQRATMRGMVASFDKRRMYWS